MNKRAISYHKKEKIPLLRNYDVVVVGAGPAGCSAAISAARNGADVLLIEKDGFPGGATVSQLVCIILSTNGVDFQGIWHEFMQTMKELNGVRDIFKSGYLYRGSLDPEIVKYGWEKMLNENEVDLLYHTYVSDIIIEKNVAKGLILETKAGRRAVKASRVIDCTGDGIICHKAGVPWEQGDYEHDYAMACTKVFRLGNVPDKPGCNGENWGITEEEYRTIEKNWKKAVANGEYTHPIITSGRVLNYTKSWRRWSLPPHRTEMMIVTSRVVKTNPVEPEGLTEAEIEGREQAWQLADFYKKYEPGCEKSYLLDTSNHIG
ncbi:MAG: FAD-dependent oxidoreductase, partial [Halanaerobiales bacterium]